MDCTAIAKLSIPCTFLWSLQKFLFMSANLNVQPQCLMFTSNVKIVAVIHKALINWDLIHDEKNPNSLNI